MVYAAEVLVVAAVAAVLATAREAAPSAAEHPSGPAGLMMPLDKTDLISGDTSGSSEYQNSVADTAKTTQCQRDGGYCFKNNKSERKKCEKLKGKVVNNICPGRNKCCIIATATTMAPPTAAPTTKPPTTTGAIENMLKEILMLINNQEMEFKSLKDNQEIILSTEISLINDVMMKLNKLDDKVDDILEHLEPTAVDCPSGTFAHSNQCFIFFGDASVKWSDAEAKCQDEGYVMPKPTDPLGLRQYLVDTYGNGAVWLGAKGDGSNMVWTCDGTRIANDDPLWIPAKQYSDSDYCLRLEFFPAYMDKDQAYYGQACYKDHINALCEWVGN